MAEKVYLAGLYSMINAMKLERLVFQEAGFECTAQWIDGNEEKQLNRHEAAQMDLDDIDAADVLVLYTLKKGTMFSSGGRMVEFGYALGKGMPVFIVGDRENVFCYLDYVVICKDTEDAIRKIKIFMAQATQPMMPLAERISLAKAAFDEFLATPVVGVT